MTPIRVLLTVPHLSNTASPYREMMALAKYASREKFSLTICSLRNNGYEETGPKLEALGVPYFTARFRPTGRRPKHLWRAIKAQKEILQHGPFAIQHSMDFTSSPFECIFARLQGRKFIRHQRNLNQNGHFHMLRVMLLFSNKLIANSEWTNRLLLELGASPSKLSKVYNGIDLEYFDQPITDSLSTTFASDATFLSVGHLAPLKRHEDAIKALHTLLPRLPHAQLRIAGAVFDHIYAQRLQQLVNELDIDSHVEFLGVRTDIPQLMKQSTALILCSESEAFPSVILEAMAAGIPVIASRSGGPEEMIIHDQTGILVAVGDVDSYARAMSEVAMCPEKRDNLGKNGRQRLEERFTASAMVKQIEEIYLQLCG